MREELQSSRLTVPVCSFRPSLQTISAVSNAYHLISGKYLGPDLSPMGLRHAQFPRAPFYHRQIEPDQVRAFLQWKS
jgi:hypothetical protein